MESNRNDHEPRTETSATLSGGASPIPPHNKPPVLTAIATPDPDPNDPVGNAINCASEAEAQKTIAQMGYYVTKISVKRKRPQAAPEAAGTETAWEYACTTIEAAFWSVRERIVEICEAFTDGQQMAQAGRIKKAATHQKST